MVKVAAAVGDGLSCAVTIVPGGNSNTDTIVDVQDSGDDISGNESDAEEAPRGDAQLPPLKPAWASPGSCANPVEIFCRIISVLLHPIVICLLLIALIFDLLIWWLRKFCSSNMGECLRREWACDLCVAISTGLVSFLRAFCLAAVGYYGRALKIMDSFRFFLSATLLVLTPWPFGRSRKLLTLARLDRTRAVVRMTKMWSRSASASRMESFQMWQEMETDGRTPDRRFECVKSQIAKGADIDFCNSEGKTVLHYFAAQLDAKYVKHLLNERASPNVQDVKGNTPLHAAAVSKYNSQDIVLTLLRDTRTDPCLYNNDGRTPLMLRLHKKKVQEPLRPVVTWDAIEEALAQQPVEFRLAALAELTPEKEPTALRLPDHLFCRASVGKQELMRRRHKIWELLLKPVTMVACVKKELTEVEKAILFYVWEASEGHVTLKEDARGAYRNQIDDVLEGTIGVIASELRKVQAELPRHCLQSLEHLPTSATVAAEDLHHGSFQGVPGWAVARDLVMAAKDLERLRVLPSAESLCDLVSRGILTCSTPRELEPLCKGRYFSFTRHQKQPRGTRNAAKSTPLQHSSSNLLRQSSSNLSPPDQECFQMERKVSIGSDHSAGWSPRSVAGRPPPSVVSTKSTQSSRTASSRGSSSSAASGHSQLSNKRDPKLEFWLGLVTLWTLALHLYARPSFIRKMLSIAQPQEVFHAPVKTFQQVMACTHEYIEDGLREWGEKVLAPLRVIDILSCVIEAASAERVAVIESELAKRFPVVVKESSYTFGANDDGGKHCHHRFLLVHQVDFTELGHVSLLVEVRVILAARVKRKQDGKGISLSKAVPLLSAPPKILKTIE